MRRTLHILRFAVLPALTLVVGSAAFAPVPLPAAYPELFTLAGIAGGSAGPDLATWQTGRQFLARTPEAFVHDANGNLLSDGRWTNTWDAEDRLVSMETLTNLPAAVPRVRLEFAYDDASRRVGKIVSVWSNEQWTAVSDRHFLWAGWNLVAEYGTQSGAGVTNSYLWGADLLGGLDSAGGVGGLLAVTRRANADTSLPVFNGNGDVMGLIDAQTGASVAQYEFGPFGETLRATGPRATANPFRFSTKYEDPESRLLYYGFRLYSPPTGRWLSEDPLEEEGSLNLYDFVDNDPVVFWDLLGLIYRSNWLHDTTAGSRVVRRWWTDDSGTPWVEADAKNLMKGVRAVTDRATAQELAFYFQQVGERWCPKNTDEAGDTIEDNRLKFGANATKVTERMAFGYWGLIGSVVGATTWAGALADIVLDRTLPVNPRSVLSSVPKAAAKSTVQEGTQVFRVWGDEAGAWGRSWTTVDPRTVPGYRGAAGLPNQNTGRFISEGVLQDTKGITLKPADPLHGNPGGLPEVVIPNPQKQIRLQNVQGLNPEF